jgi:hypothetical protein
VEETSAETDSENNMPAAKQGWRTAAEVVQYLSSKGAKMQTLQRPIEGDWAAVSNPDFSTGAEDSEPEM